MSNSRNILYWTAGAAGIMLLYAAYKGESPLAELQGFFSAKGAGSTQAITTVTGNTDPTGLTGASPSASDVQGSGYSGSTNSSETSDGTYVYDANGNIVGEVPALYKNSPGTYIPSKTMA